MFRTKDTGDLKEEMILVCNALRNDLMHANEYVCGSTLRRLGQNDKLGAWSGGWFKIKAWKKPKGYSYAMLCWLKKILGRNRLHRVTLFSVFEYWDDASSKPFNLNCTPCGFVYRPTTRRPMIHRPTMHVHPIGFVSKSTVQCSTPSR